ncbi:cupin domain-containing protein [Oleiagrimonas sp. MCCC 1A03011]|uniref:cupin domain-containing protein n=1 Tax=Oleiagrimonas sp. MCCC 1A03011 TaxID=1926883 RepID=UPI000DC32306|nr:cupin domain-containing protein [Oleiagrimonas sp. MCCC 1A03011]RAP57808.1 transcriptional regulator [Oleiagrimonas sp. MCCC 1A03011]
MPKLDLDRIPAHTGSSYPPPHDAACADRVRQRLGEAGGLTDFGVNLLELPPGVHSSQRHWHSDEDEFAWIVRGEVVLVTDEGETVLHAGDCAAFPKGERDGHQLINRSQATAICLEVGSRSAQDICRYPDIDMIIDATDDVYRHRDGTPWPR